MKVYAEDINYFRTSKKHAETWIEDAKKLIAGIGGKILSELYGTDSKGQGAFSLEFQIGTDVFRIVWSVLPVKKSGNEHAAKIQAATLLFHDVKHKVVMAKIRGIRSTFLEYLVLPSGQPAGEAVQSDPELFFAHVPNVIRLSATVSDNK